MVGTKGRGRKSVASVIGILDEQNDHPREDQSEKQQDSMGNVKPVVKTSTMEQDLQDEVILVAQHAMDTEIDEQQIAAKVKQYFEQKYHGMLWHCCVGRNVACYVTHEQSKFLYFYIGQMAVVLFATA